MYDDENPRDAIGRALPETEPPPNFDLDRMISDGYRSRRRGRIVLGGATAAGVTAVAAAIALVVAMSPDGAVKDVDAADEAAPQTPVESLVDDPAMAGYPAEDKWWSYDEAERLSSAVREAFGPLLIDSGALTEEEFAGEDDPSDEEIQDYADERGISFEEAEEAYVAEEVERPLDFSGEETPGNYGQVQLRSYTARAVDPRDDENSEGPIRTFLTVEALLPGGWTPEPGPITEQLFPQHLIGDGPYYTEQAPEFTSTALEDGRTLLVADHGCAVELAMVYPNGNALRATWDASCSSDEYPVDLAELEAAMTAIEEPQFDINELTAVEEVLEVPDAWLAGDDSWADEADADATADAVETAVQDRYPGATIIDDSVGIPFPHQATFDRGQTEERRYTMQGTLPFDTAYGEPGLNVQYFLPGGWLPGLNEEGQDGPYLESCFEKLDFECEQIEYDGRIAVVQQMQAPEGSTDVDYRVMVFHPDGWAVKAMVSFNGEVDFSAEDLLELTASLPAPVYDEEALPAVPAL